MKYPEADLVSLAHGMISVNAIIQNLNPDIVLAPMMGAVPLIDLLNVVNPQFDNERVVYVPASSSIQSLNNILPVTIRNVLKDRASVDTIAREGYSILSIDEVVSGSSAVRVRSKVKEGLKAYAGSVGDAGLADKITLDQIGIEHMIHKESGKQWNNGYADLRNTLNLIPVQVHRIITMDDPALCPAKYVPKPDGTRNTPKLQPVFTITGEYLNLLANIARIVGTDPNQAYPRNFQQILEQQHYVPDRYMNEPIPKDVHAIKI
jgi:hypothetical protein